MPLDTHMATEGTEVAGQGVARHVLTWPSLYKIRESDGK